METGMRVFNEDKTQELQDYDLNVGHIQNDQIITHHDAVIVHHDAIVVHHDAVIVHHDAIVAHHDAVASVPEQGHYEVVAEYQNGGKDVRWVVDVQGVEGHDEYDDVISKAYDETVSTEYDEVISEAYDETISEAYDDIEPIGIYIPYTQSELLLRELESCLAWLDDHDYIGVKIATGRATVEEYADVIAEMNIKAERINELKALLAESSD